MIDRTSPFSRPLRASELGMRGEIAAKWSKFRMQEIEDLRSNDELVRHVQSKYGLQHSQAQKEVETFAKGRRIEASPST